MPESEFTKQTRLLERIRRQLEETTDEQSKATRGSTSQTPSAGKDTKDAQKSSLDQITASLGVNRQTFANIPGGGTAFDIATRGIRRFQEATSDAERLAPFDERIATALERRKGADFVRLRERAKATAEAQVKGQEALTTFQDALEPGLRSRQKIALESGAALAGEVEPLVKVLDKLIGVVDTASGLLFKLIGAPIRVTSDGAAGDAKSFHTNQQLNAQLPTADHIMRIRDQQLRNIPEPQIQLAPEDIARGRARR